VRRLAATAVAGALAAVAGCGGGGASDAADAGIFLAVASDFADYQSWQSNTTESAVASGSTHVSGRRTVYINQLPPAGATEFPIGTMIVKETETDGKIFARAKRGGDFNKSGAKGWEWFELERGANGISVSWHGWGPPAGEKYGGDAGGGCNGCHAAAAANDYVLSPWLALSSSNDGVDGGDGGTTTDAAGE
jgi:hypothetical protein